MVHTHSQNTETNQISLIDTCFALFWCYSFFIMYAHCHEKPTNFQVNFSTITRNRTIIISEKKSRLPTIFRQFHALDISIMFRSQRVFQFENKVNHLNIQNRKTKDLADNDVIVCLTYSFIFFIHLKFYR